MPQLLIRYQSAPAAATPTTLYTVPASTTTVISEFLVCNRANVIATYRIAVRALGATLANQHYKYYDAAIAPNDTFVANIGSVALATDIIEVYASNGNLTFHLSGEENS